MPTNKKPGYVNGMDEQADGRALVLLNVLPYPPIPLDLLKVRALI